MSFCLKNGIFVPTALISAAILFRSAGSLGEGNLIPGIPIVENLSRSFGSHSLA
jgi:hypothetical protein